MAKNFGFFEEKFCSGLEVLQKMCKMAKKSGQMAIFEKIFGHEKTPKIGQNGLKKAVFGPKSGVFGCFLMKNQVCGQKPTFVSYFI